MNRKDTITALVSHGPEYVYDTLFPQWDGMLRHRIPEHMRDGMVRWIAFGILPGSFLTAVLENDLRGAVHRGDDLNRNSLVSYIVFLHNYAPTGCWGSPEKVDDWKGIMPAEVV